MLALIIADNSFAAREHALLSRIEVGLADEGVRVIHAAPAAARAQPSATFGIQSSLVAYQPPTLPLQSSIRRSAQILLAAAEKTSEDPLRIDIVHAFGAPCWPIAVEAARAANAALLLELWDPGLIPAAADLLARARRTTGTPTPEFLTSEAAVATALTTLDSRARVYSAPWGVHIPSRPRTIHPTGEAHDLSFAVMYDTGDPRTLAAPLAGIAQATKGVADAFIVGAIDDATSRRESRLWDAARKLNLLDRFSILPDIEARRDPVLAMDFLLLPEPRGRQRTLTLEAMARGMAVIATPDPSLEFLSDGTTARLVSANSTNPAKAWADAINSLIRNTAAHSDLTRAAHEHMRSNRTASTHIADILRAYQQAAAAKDAATIA
jgi:hypothetical protein